MEGSRGLSLKGKVAQERVRNKGERDEATHFLRWLKISYAASRTLTFSNIRLLFVEEES